jgi:putative ABC transport system permease protein
VERVPAVIGHSGPYPMTFALLTSRGITTSAMLEGREAISAPLDQPALTAGSWIRRGGLAQSRAARDS